MVTTCNTVFFSPSTVDTRRIMVSSWRFPIGWRWWSMFGERKKSVYLTEEMNFKEANFYGSLLEPSWRVLLPPGLGPRSCYDFPFFRRRLTTMHTPHHHPVSSLLWTLFCIGPLLLPLRFIRPCISLFCSVSSTGFLYLPLLFLSFLIRPTVFSALSSHPPILFVVQPFYIFPWPPHF